MGRHRLPSKRRKSSAALALAIAPAAVVFAAGSDVRPARQPAAESVTGDVAAYRVQMVAAGPTTYTTTAESDAGQVVAASRWRVVQRDVPHLLPAGLASEQGLQVKTILVSRTISEVFPAIQSIGGVRADALRWHPNGLALDVMIPNPGSAEGIALGDQIVAFALENAERFGLQDCIWRGMYYTPGGAQRGGYGHYDHVHITTTGGGYPTGGEVYIR